MTMPRMPGQKAGDKYLTKTITIRPDQDEFLKKNALSLSRFVQQRIDEAMNAGKAKKL